MGHSKEHARQCWGRLELVGRQAELVSEVMNISSTQTILWYFDQKKKKCDCICPCPKNQPEANTLKSLAFLALAEDIWRQSSTESALWLLVLTLRQIYNEKKQTEQGKIQTEQFVEKRSAKELNIAKACAEGEAVIIKERPLVLLGTLGRLCPQGKTPLSWDFNLWKEKFKKGCLLLESNCFNTWKLVEVMVHAKLAAILAHPCDLDFGDMNDIRVKRC